MLAGDLLRHHGARSAFVVLKRDANLTDVGSVAVSVAIVGYKVAALRLELAEAGLEGHVRRLAKNGLVFAAPLDFHTRASSQLFNMGLFQQILAQLDL